MNEEKEKKELCGKELYNESGYGKFKIPPQLDRNIVTCANLKPCPVHSPTMNEEINKILEEAMERIKSLSDEPISANLDASIRMALDENISSTYQKGLAEGERKLKEAMIKSGFIVGYREGDAFKEYDWNEAFRLSLSQQSKGK